MNIQDRQEERNKEVAELRKKWFAPLRCIHATAIDKSGQWGAALSRLEQKQDTGVVSAICGNHGSGKTQMGFELMKRSVEELRGAVYVGVTEFYISIRATGKPSIEATAVDVISQLRGPRFLVMDGFCAYAEAPWENLMLWELLDRRYHDKRDTLLIANLSYQEFITSIGSSLASRMLETGGIIECNWKSFRQ